LTEKNDVYNIFDSCKSKFDELDFKNIWVYDKNGYRFGGIDEWAFDNLEDFGYTSAQIKYEEIKHRQFFIPKYNNHPNPIVYFILSKFFLKDCKFINHKENSIDEIMKQIDIDLNCDNEDGSIIFPSKNTIEQIFRIKMTNKLL